MSDKIKTIIQLMKRALDRDDPIQIFDTIGLVPDDKIELYASGAEVVYYCPHWEYFEVVGFSEKEFTEIYDAMHGFTLEIGDRPEDYDKVGSLATKIHNLSMILGD